ncbi:Glucoamylase, partial [Termitomyces sp. T112]
DQYTLGEDRTLRGHIDDFVWSQTILQQIPNPSGNLITGGLGEPKFLISLAAFTDGWGRPQKDGPALRSIALITYANWLLEQSNTTHVTQKIWPIVKLDLDYVSTRWNSSGYDLWEEVSSASFFTSAVQHRALRQGVTFAKKIGQTGITNKWAIQADNILCFLQTFWNPIGLHITSNTKRGRSGIDANSALASIHTFDASAGCDAATFQPCSDKALASLKVYVDSFRAIYTINNGTAAHDAVATGRYPEDVYYGGNPWYLTTAAVAEQLYDALIVWKAQKSVAVTSISLAFFQQFLPSIQPGIYMSSSKTYTILVNAIKQHADD